MRSSIPDPPSRLRAEIPTWYSGPIHLLFTVTWPLLAIAGCLGALEHTIWHEWLTVPLTFVYACIVEYVAHRQPMHQRRRWAAPVFKGHMYHHRFFTVEAFAYANSKEWYGLLMPPYMVLYFFVAFMIPVMLLLYAAVSANVAYLFMAVAVAYYLNYELVHFCCHAPAKSAIARLPIIRWIRAHHQAHHDGRMMSHYNFNVTYPWVDYLFGTGARAALRKPAGIHCQVADSEAMHVAAGH